MTISENLDRINDDIRKFGSGEVLLLCVSKTHPVEKIMETYDLGYRDYGENKVQELLKKKPLLPQDINWHLIGHLQTNKVKDIVGEVCLIHSVDSLKLLKKIDQEAGKKGLVQDILLELNISKEESKTGFYEEDLDEAINLAKDLENIRIRGLMTMAPFTDDEELVRDVFKKARKIFDNLSDLSYNNIDMTFLSMGMTNDYRIALEEGSNIIRIGTKIYGKRE